MSMFLTIFLLNTFEIRLIPRTKSYCLPFVQTDRRFQNLRLFYLKTAQFPI